MPFSRFTARLYGCGIKGDNQQKIPRKAPDASFDLSEVKQSHVIKLREFLDTDLDFFDSERKNTQNEKEKPHTDKRKSSAAKRKASSLSVQKDCVRSGKEQKRYRQKTARAEAVPPTPSGKKSKNFGSSSEFEEILSELEKYKQYTAFDGSSASRRPATRTKARKRTAARKHNNKRAVKTNECHSKSFFGGDVRICASKP